MRQMACLICRLIAGGIRIRADYDEEGPAQCRFGRFAFPVRPRRCRVSRRAGALGTTVVARGDWGRNRTQRGAKQTQGLYSGGRCARHWPPVPVACRANQHAAVFGPRRDGHEADDGHPGGPAARLPARFQAGCCAWRANDSRPDSCCSWLCAVGIEDPSALLAGAGACHDWGQKGTASRMRAARNKSTEPSTEGTRGCMAHGTRAAPPLSRLVRAVRPMPRSHLMPSVPCAPSPRLLVRVCACSVLPSPAERQHRVILT